MRNRLDQFITRQRFARLEGNRVVRCTLEEWALGGYPRQIAYHEQGEYWVSTVFLGMDHRFTGSVRPLWFESMLFKGDKGIDSDRYSTLEEALRGHAAMVAELQG